MCLVLALDEGIRVSGVLSDAFLDACGRRVRHAEVGGVTDCSIWMGSSAAINRGALEVILYRRSSGRVLKPTLRERCGKRQMCSRLGRQLG
jgi:hypothetical protein